MNLLQAQTIAERLKAELAPYCERIEIAGSIRRQKAEVKDIELVVIPKRVVADMFGTATEPHPDFCRIINALEKVKGEPTGKYTQRILPEGIKVDIFIADADNWGLIYAIRTGSADFSYKILGGAWVRCGYKSVNGYLMSGDTRVPVREEAELFALLRLPFTPPEERTV